MRHPLPGRTSESPIPTYSVEDQLAWARNRASYCEKAAALPVPRYESLVDLLEELKKRRAGEL